MPTDSFKTVLYNDGEGLAFGDLNDSQRFLAARLNDQLFEKMIGGVSATAYNPDFPHTNGANASTSFLYALTVGGASPIQGSANNKIKISAGTLFQKLGNATGDEPTLVAFTFDGTDEVTISNGDPTHARLDLVQVKLEYVDGDSQTRDFKDASTGVITSTTCDKKRRVQCTISVKQGTPAASPTWPSPDTGYVPFAYVLVGAAYAGAAGFKFREESGSSNATIYDMRMPINVKTYVVPAKHGQYNSAAWSPSSSFSNHLVKSVTAGDLWIPCPVTKGRILGVALGYQAASAIDLELGAAYYGPGPADMVYAPLAIIFDVDVGNFNFGGNLFSYWDPVTVAGPTPTVNPGAHNIPVWADGSRCQHAPLSNDLISQPESTSFCVLKVGGMSSGDIVTHAVFYVAEGF